MRAIVLAAGLGLALGLGACASTGAGHATYAEELAELRGACDARGGILTPIAGSTGPNAANDYACEIRGGGSGRLD